MEELNTKNFNTFLNFKEKKKKRYVSLHHLDMYLGLLFPKGWVWCHGGL